MKFTAIINCICQLLRNILTYFGIQFLFKLIEKLYEVYCKVRTNRRNMIHTIRVEDSKVIINRYDRFKNHIYEERIDFLDNVEFNLHINDAINRSVREYYNYRRY